MFTEKDFIKQINQPASEINGLSVNVSFRRRNDILVCKSITGVQPIDLRITMYTEL